MQCEIWFPGSYDWHNMTTEEVVAKRYTRDENILRLITNWDQNHCMTYPQFRASVKEIAAANWKRMNVPVVRCPTHSKETYYLTTDDDDWFNPRIPDIVGPLFEKYPEIDVIRWNCWSYLIFNPKIHEGHADDFHLWTNTPTASNGFAIRGSVPPPGYCGLHQIIDGWPELVQIPQVLSVYVRHPAAYFTLSCEDISTTSHRKRRPIPECLEWAKQEIDSLYTLVCKAARPC